MSDINLNSPVSDHLGDYANPLKNSRPRKRAKKKRQTPSQRNITVTDQRHIKERFKKLEAKLAALNRQVSIYMKRQLRSNTKRIIKLEIGRRR